MAGGPGFEPGLPGPEPGVLPLNYPPFQKTDIRKSGIREANFLDDLRRT